MRELKHSQCFYGNQKILAAERRKKKISAEVLPFKNENGDEAVGECVRRDTDSPLARLVLWSSFLMFDLCCCFFFISLLSPSLSLFFFPSLSTEIFHFCNAIDHKNYFNLLLSRLPFFALLGVSHNSTFFFF